MTIATTREIQEAPPDGLLASLVSRMATVALTLFIGGVVMRKWLNGYTRQVCRTIVGATQQAAEPRVPRQAGPHGELPCRSSPDESEGVATLASGLVEARVQAHFANERAQRLQGEFDELAADYNNLVADTLQQGADRFQGKEPREPSGPARHHSFAASAVAVPVVSFDSPPIGVKTYRRT
ncbi:hypothetical protein [Streptomyces sp. BH104]|uniref:hypothetical protein n=1 Tax=Streptomyces sp. BH104 TaxID=3410407 RepID=UPI003BB4F558